MVWRLSSIGCCSQQGCWDCRAEVLKKFFTAAQAIFNIVLTWPFIHSAKASQVLTVGIACKIIEFVFMVVVLWVCYGNGCYLRWQAQLHRGASGSANDHIIQLWR